MDQILQDIQTLITESNQLFAENKFEKAAANAEKAYSLAINHDKCSRSTRRKIQFNLAAIYTASNNLHLAKNWLDHVKSRSVPLKKYKELAILYTKLGKRFRNDKESSECYQMACEFYAKSKSWSEFCTVGLIHAKLMCDLGLYKKSVSIGNKILAATFYLSNPIESAKIYNDLSTVYSKDTRNLENVYYSKRLLKKALKLLNGQNLDRDLDLELYIYQNLSAVYNQLENYSASLKFIERAYENAKAPNKYMHLLSDLKYNEGYAHFKQNDFECSINAFQQSHQFALKTNQNNIYESLEALTTVYYLKNQLELAKENHEKAIKYFEQFYLLRNLQKNKNIENRLIFKYKQLLKDMKLDSRTILMKRVTPSGNIEGKFIENHNFSRKDTHGHNRNGSNDESKENTKRDVEAAEIQHDFKSKNKLNEYESDDDASMKKLVTKEFEECNNTRNSNFCYLMDNGHEEDENEIPEKIENRSLNEETASSVAIENKASKEKETENGLEEVQEKVETERRRKSDQNGGDKNDNDHNRDNYLPNFKKEIEQRIAEEDSRSSSRLKYSHSSRLSSNSSPNLNRDDTTSQLMNYLKINNSESTLNNSSAELKNSSLMDNNEIISYYQQYLDKEHKEEEEEAEYKKEQEKSINKLSALKSGNSNNETSDNKQFNIYSIRNQKNNKIKFDDRIDVITEPIQLQSQYQNQPLPQPALVEARLKKSKVCSIS